MKYTFSLCAAILMLSCQQEKLIPQQQEIIPVKTEEQLDSMVKTFTFSYQEPKTIAGTPLLIIPLQTNKIIERKEQIGLMSSIYKQADASTSNFWNFMFYNTKTRVSTVLTQKKINILNYELPTPNAHAGLSNRILYTGNEEDKNCDGFLNHEDPLGLYVSTTEGSGFKRISPIEEQLINYNANLKTGQLIYSTRIDLNKDSLFSEEDPTNYYLIDFARSDSSEIVISMQQREEMKKLFITTWLK